jgi:hypothetical protein
MYHNIVTPRSQGNTLFFEALVIFPADNMHFLFGDFVYVERSLLSGLTYSFSVTKEEYIDTPPLTRTSAFLAKQWTHWRNLLVGRKAFVTSVCVFNDSTINLSCMSSWLGLLHSTSIIRATSPSARFRLWKKVRKYCACLTDSDKEGCNVESKEAGQAASRFHTITTVMEAIRMIFVQSGAWSEEVLISILRRRHTSMLRM